MVSLKLIETRMPEVMLDPCALWAPGMKGAQIKIFWSAFWVTGGEGSCPGRVSQPQIILDKYPDPGIPELSQYHGIGVGTRSMYQYQYWFLILDYFSFRIIHISITEYSTWVVSEPSYIEFELES